MEPIGAVITAGGRMRWSDFAQLPDYPAQEETYIRQPLLIKALLRVNNRTLLQTVLEAVWNSQKVEQVAVVGSPQLRCWLSQSRERLIPERFEAHENLIVGLEALQHYPRVLYVTSDLPFVTAEAVSQFIEACSADSAISYAVVRREVFEQRFPNSPSTYAQLKEGEFAAGCALLVDPKALLRHADWIRRVAQSRKSLWRLATLAGGSILWRYVTRRLSIADLERRAQQLLGVRCEAVESPPELAYDIDTPQEYTYAQRFADDRTG